MIHYTMLGLGIVFLGGLIVFYGKKMISLIEEGSKGGTAGDTNMALVKRMKGFVGFLGQNATSNSVVSFIVAFWPFLRNHATYQLSFAWTVGLLCFAFAANQFKV